MCQCLGTPHVRTPAAVAVAFLLVPSGLGGQLGALGVGLRVSQILSLCRAPQQVLPGNTEGGSGQCPGVQGTTDGTLSGTYRGCI